MPGGGGGGCAWARPSQRLYPVHAVASLLHVHAHPAPSLCRPGLYCFTVVSGSAVVNSSAVYTIVGKSDLAASPLQDSVATLDAVGPAQCVGLTDSSCCFAYAGPTPCSTHSETRCFPPSFGGLPTCPLIVPWAWSPASLVSVWRQRQVPLLLPVGAQQHPGRHLRPDPLLRRR